MDAAQLEIVDFKGTPRTRGRAHGEHFSQRIHELLDLWATSLRLGYGVDPREYVDFFFAQTGYERATQVWAPGVLEEVRGIAEGSGADYRRLLAFQHVNEEFELGPRLARAAPASDACSTIVAPPHAERAALLAQNLDLAQFLDGFQVLLRVNCDDSDGDILMLSVPGMISLMGMNSHGLAVCDNSLTQLRSDLRGLPIYALYRLILERRSCAEARELIERIPHAVGLNWVIGDAAGVDMLERSAAQSVRYSPAGQAPLAYHTNHPLACNDWQDAFSHVTPPRPTRSTYLRLAALHQRLHGVEPGAISVQLLKETLASRDDQDYPVSRGGGCNVQDQHIGFTLACNIFELRRGELTWHLAPGPPHETEFRTFRFS